MTTIISERKPLIKVSTIRKDEELGNISVAIRRLLAYEIPDRIFEIHIIDGIANTSVCDYITLEWENCFVIGEAIDVAITFDGHWQRGSLDKLVLITDELPYIFWVDADNALYEQVWDIDSTRQLLATEVIKVKSIRAWKNVNFPNLDHGLVVAYIKTDGKVYYRNYCQQADGSLVWELEREVTQFTGIAVNLNLFITNDYRTGIIIQDAQEKIHWLITSRNWAGMAIAPENLFAKPKISVAFIETNKIKAVCHDKIITTPSVDVHLLYAATYNEFTEIANIDDGLGDYGRFVNFTTRYELFELNPLDFTLVDSDDVTFIAISVTKISELQYQAELSDFNNANGNTRLVFSGLYGQNEAGYAYSAFEGSFLPIGLVPTTKEPPKVEVIWNE